MYSYSARCCGLAFALLSATGVANDASPAEPALSSITCRAYLRVRDLPANKPLIKLHKFASTGAAVVAGLPSGTVLEPEGPPDGNWQAVRWNGSVTGYVSRRHTESFTVCEPTVSEQSCSSPDHEGPVVNAAPRPASVVTRALFAISTPPTYGPSPWARPLPRGRHELRAVPDAWSGEVASDGMVLCSKMTYAEAFADLSRHGSEPDDAARQVRETSGDGAACGRIPGLQLRPDKYALRGYKGLPVEIVLWVDGGTKYYTGWPRD